MSHGCAIDRLKKKCVQSFFFVQTLHLVLMQSCFLIDTPKGSSKLHEHTSLQCVLNFNVCNSFKRCNVFLHIYKKSLKQTAKRFFFFFYRHHKLKQQQPTELQMEFNDSISLAIFNINIMFVATLAKFR